MRALLRYALAPLAIAAALLSAGTPAHMPAAAAAPHLTKFVPLDCPAGTSWDNILHICD